MKGSANEICKSTISFVTGDPSKVRPATERNDERERVGWGVGAHPTSKSLFPRDYCRIEDDGSVKDSADRPRFLPGSEHPRKMTRLIGK